MDRRTLLAALLLPVPAQAHSLSIGAIAIGHAWALPANHVDGQAFSLLFAYISGANRGVSGGSERVAMTVPVDVARPEGIAMTAPEKKPVRITMGMLPTPIDSICNRMSST